jgi:hypothetical protein
MSTRYFFAFSASMRVTRLQLALSEVSRQFHDEIRNTQLSKNMFANISKTMKAHNLPQYHHQALFRRAVASRSVAACYDELHDAGTMSLLLPHGDGQKSLLTKAQAYICTALTADPSIQWYRAELININRMMIGHCPISSNIPWVEMLLPLDFDSGIPQRQLKSVKQRS